MTPEEIIDELTLTKPYLLIELVKRGKPYLNAIEERCQALQHGTIDLTITVRAGEVMKMELKEAKTWLAPKSPIDAKSQG